jgi:RNA polymerase sigma factor (sigma-70 family)
MTMPDSKRLTADELLGHGVWLRRLADRLVGEAGAADLVQDTWISALLHRPQVPGPWLRRVLHNRAASAARARSRRQMREEAHARPEALPSACDLAVRAETTRLLVEAVLRLKPVQRDVILLRYFDDLSPAQIAEHLGLCAATVRSHLARGLARLRRDLDANCGGDRTRWTRALALFQAKGAAAHTAGFLGTVLMTTMQKLGVVLALALAGIGTYWWRTGADGPAFPQTPDEREVLGSATAPEEQSAPNDPKSRADGGASHRVVADASSAVTRRIQVVHGDTGAILPNATVLHVAAGFDWELLTPAAKEDYSLATERFLQENGESRVSDDHGLVEIPALAANAAVVGRKGDLYGVGVQRKEGGLWTLALSPHYQLVVEVVDASGGPVAGIRVLQESLPSAFNPFPLVTPLGTTDEHGLVSRALEAPATGARPQKLSVYASLPGARVGAFELNPQAPPSGPVRITLPAVGSVSLLILDPSGKPLDPSTLADPNVELVCVDPAAATPKGAGPFQADRHRASIEPDGWARFQHVPVGLSLSISAPALLARSLRCQGPREGKLDVVLEHRMHQDHPMLIGRLVDSDSRPMPNARFSILCRSGEELLPMVGGATDEQGNFSTFLSEQTMGKQPGEVSFGMDWEGLTPTREARVSLRGPLIGKTQVGEVVMPAKK